MKRNLSIHILVACLILLSSFSSIAQQKAGEIFEIWKEGRLDIHHINTGRGNATFFILPDGTTLLIDAGELELTDPRTQGPRNTTAKPDSTRHAGEWIARYIAKATQFRSTDQAIDYAVITHFHDDHMGMPSSVSKKSANGKYVLTGITEVGDWMPIRTMIDRGWPDYAYPRALNDKSVQNYRAFLDWQVKNKGMKVEKSAPGRNDQLKLTRNPGKYAGLFEIRNIAANGEIWTGVGTVTRQHFPELKTLSPQLYPHENMCSTALKISYGKFDYFSGGDIPGVLQPGVPVWHDVETPVAKAVGPVDVHILDHHGNRDSQNDCLLQALRPRVLVIPVWSSDHPGHDVLDRIYSQRIYSGDRDVFATDMLQPNKLVIGEMLGRLKSDKGHIVVSVQPGGDRYFVYVLDDENESQRIKSVHGPYESK